MTYNYKLKSLVFCPAMTHAILPSYLGTIIYKIWCYVASYSLELSERYLQYWNTEETEEEIASDSPKDYQVLVFLAKSLRMEYRPCSN